MIFQKIALRIINNIMLNTREACQMNYALTFILWWVMQRKMTGYNQPVDAFFHKYMVNLFFLKLGCCFSMHRTVKYTVKI